MAKRLIGSVVVIAAVAGIALAATPREGSGDDATLRNLLLRAAGAQALRPGEVRTIVPVDGTEYEVIGVAPGEPRVLPVAR